MLAIKKKDWDVLRMNRKHITKRQAHHLQKLITITHPPNRYDMKELEKEVRIRRNIRKSQEHFVSMIKDHRIKPSIETLNSLLGLYAETGQTFEMTQLFEVFILYLRLVIIHHQTTIEL